MKPRTTTCRQVSSSVSRVALAVMAVGFVAGLWSGMPDAASHIVPAERIASARQLLQEADKRAAQIPAGSQQTAARLAIARFKARAGDVDDAIRALATMPRPYDASLQEVVRDIAAAQAVRGDIAGALQHAAALSHASDVHAVLAGVASALARAGRSTDALNLITRAKDDAGREKIVIGIALGLLEAGDQVGALAALRSTPGTGGPRSALLEAFLHARNGNVAEARRTGARAGDDMWLFGFVQRAHAQARAGDGVGAFTTVGYIPTGDFRSSGEAAVASGQARGGDVAGALTTAANISEESRPVAYTDIAIVQAQRGDVAGARRTAGLIQIPGNQAAALVEVSRASARSGDVAGALGIARSISFAEYRRNVLKAVVEARAEVGDVAGALAIIPTLGGDEQRGLELTIAMVRARAGDPSLVLQIIRGPDLPGEPTLWLLAVVADLLRTPVEDPATAPFRALDFHPFQ